ncbi:MAG TPA: hotdog domain-containing protein, partial [Bacteroidia bacterium]|nr:hotdog domain-containing protein [Bacteroidia bacterium]
LPVSEFSIQYKKPAFYDDVLTIKTVIRKRPSVRIYFDYETFNEKGELLNTASVTLVFVSKETGKPINPTEEFNKVFTPYFQN